MISDFYSDSVVLLTGVSGFLGKAILEKILRSIPSVKQVCVLLRHDSKNALTAQQRIHKILAESTLFNSVRKQYKTTESLLSKVFAVSGDIEKPNLGLSDQDYSYLISNVSVIIHSAASVKFNDKLAVALNINFDGTGRVIKLAREMNEKGIFKSFVYVSTAYANCNKSIVTEEIDITATPQTEQDETNVLKLLSGRPNTYTYSKAAAETLLLNLPFPTVIVRPSIIGATWRTPFPGFVDCFTGITGFFAAVGKGVSPCLTAREEAVLDLVPLDVIANVVVASAAISMNCSNDQRTPLVLNCCSGPSNPITLGELKDIVVNCPRDEEPFKETLLRRVSGPKVLFTRYRIVYYIITFLLCVVPFAAYDLIQSLIKGKRTWSLLRTLAHCHEMYDSTEFFRMNEWEFRQGNLEILKQKMTPEEREEFYFDLGDLDWVAYIRNYIRGVGKFVAEREGHNKMRTGKKSGGIYHRNKTRLLLCVFALPICFICSKTNLVESFHEATSLSTHLLNQTEASL